MLLRRFQPSLFFAACLALVCTAASAQTAPSAATPPEPLSVVVFSDFACPYSAQEYFTLQKLQKQYPGRLHVVFKNSPLPLHPGAPLAHRAALAADRQGKYDEMAELLYSNQMQQERPALIAYARRLHLDVVKFERDLDAPAVKDQLAADLEEGRAFGVDQTPAIFFNGHPFKGLQSDAVFLGLIDGANSLSQDLAKAATASQLDPGFIAQMQSKPTAAQGAPNAPLTLVEFTDFQCPFCRASVAPMEQLMAERGQQVRWVFRAFPLDFHPDAELAAEAALAAGEQGKFWPMHDLLFSHQTALKLPDLRAYAEQLGLNMSAFDDALTTHRFAAQIAEDRAMGIKAGVDGTPTFVIDGHLLTGTRSLQELEQLAEAHRVNPNMNVAAAGAGVTMPTVAADHVVTQAENPATAVTLTWYTDVRSPLAARQAELMRSLGAHYNGRLRVVFKAYPVPAHADSALASSALLAALKQNNFWAMYDALADRRDVFDEAKLLSLAQALKLDVPKFREDLHAAAEDVAADRDEATRRGIQGAPVIFIDAQRVDGLQREPFYTAIVDDQLKGKPVQAATAR
ncbi:MAG TPA: thioredoxin domain-containing protein [Acidobacteriaceae bacterium]|jgi:protein-disulfide isomerase